MSPYRTAAGLLLFVLVAVACSGQPVSLSAQAGSTIAIPIGGETVENGKLGYGGQVLATGDPPKYDDQRGELVVTLQDEADPSRQFRLVTQAVVNAYPDPGSPVGIANIVAVEEAPPVAISQALAIVDIPSPTADPPGPTPGPYKILVSRRVRSSAAEPPAYQPLTPSPLYSAMNYQLTILDGAGTPTPLRGGTSGYDVDAKSGIRSLYPYPRIPLRLPLAGGVTPSAAHMVVAYSPAKISVKSVFENLHLGRGSMMSFSDDPASGMLTIDLINGDPLSAARDLSIAFELENPFGSGSTGGRATPADFTVQTLAVYDANGALVNSNPGSVSKLPIR